jgi:MFS family permease
VITAFILVYITTSLGMSRQTGLNAVLIGSAIHFVTIPLWGALSDRVGRKRVYLLGAIGMGVWGFVFFELLDSKSFAVMTFAVTVGLVLHGAMYGPQAAFFSELFGTRVRYSGASIGYQLASVAAGALAPIIAVALLRDTNSTVPISVYMALMCVVTVVAVLLARETRGVSLDSVTAEVPATRAASDEIGAKASPVST